MQIMLKAQSGYTVEVLIVAVIVAVSDRVIQNGVLVVLVCFSSHNCL